MRSHIFWQAANSASGNEVEKEFIKGTICTTTPGAEALAPVLESLGITAYSIEDPADIAFVRGDFIDTITEGEAGAASGLSSEVSISFWVERDAGGSGEAVIEALRARLLKLKGDEQYGIYGAGADFGRLWLQTEVCADDWKDKYKETFKGFSPCKGLHVVPPWETGEDRDGTVIVIDPGMAFGTGSHETTAMCLEAVKEHVKPGSVVLDAGTGSGILAIVCALLGAGDVDAVEIDEDAAASAAANIEANGVQDRVWLVTGDLSEVIGENVYDLILANLNCVILEGLIPLFYDALRDAGGLIVSGILAEQEERILKVLEKGFRGSKVMRRGEWVMIEAVR